MKSLQSGRLLGQRYQQPDCAKANPEGLLFALNLHVRSQPGQLSERGPECSLVLFLTAGLQNWGPSLRREGNL